MWRKWLAVAVIYVNPNHPVAPHHERIFTKDAK